jgi:uncharacterized metal-binding protein
VRSLEIKREEYAMADFKVVIATCYGAANTGQLAGAVATELVKENEDYHLVCLPAVAIDKDTGLNKIAGAELFVIIEGCPVMCCTKIVDEHSGRKPDIRVEMVEDYGVKKTSALEVDPEEKERIKADVKRRIEEALQVK